MPTIAVLGALDTKGIEFAFLIDRIRARGHKPFIIDTSVLSEPLLAVDITAERVAAAGGSDLVNLREQGDRGSAMLVMARGAAAVVSELQASGSIDAVIGMGGSGGSSVFAAAARELPTGFPKVLVTTMASGDTRNLVGVTDLVLIPSVVDIAGLNRISRRIIANAAGAVCGMVEAGQEYIERDRPVIAATMLGNTTPAVEHARTLLEDAGYEVLVFHAIGTGGRTMESLISSGMIAGVLDLTITELASELTGSPCTAGPKRLKAAGERGIPQVISVGCADFSIFGRPESLPDRCRDRQVYAWNPETTLMRLNVEESTHVGRLIADRVNAGSGPAAVILPLGGLSQVSEEGGPFYCPKADEALFEAIREALRPGIPLIEIEAHINHQVFAEKAVELLLEMLPESESLV